MNQLNLIEKSGTGIEKSGTGQKRRRTIGSWLGVLAMTVTPLLAQAEEPSIMISQSDRDILVSMHVNNRIIAGRQAVSSQQHGLFVIDLHEMSLGTTNSGLLTHGSGTGSLSPDCNVSGLATHGSGTGSTKPCTAQTQATRWGQAELVADPAGWSILINRDGKNGPEEVLATFQVNSRASNTQESLSSGNDSFDNNPVLTQR